MSINNASNTNMNGVKVENQQENVESVYRQVKKLNFVKKKAS